MNNRENLDLLKIGIVPANDAIASQPSCCSPASATLDRAPSGWAGTWDLASESDSDHARLMVSLPGGEFLMGTDYKDAFSADGEGPVRAVSLAAFQMDAFPVTNRDFAYFVEATGYRTEAERFGWSFIFWSSYGNCIDFRLQHAEEVELEKIGESRLR